LPDRGHRGDASLHEAVVIAGGEHLAGLDGFDGLLGAIDADHERLAIGAVGGARRAAALKRVMGAEHCRAEAEQALRAEAWLAAQALDLRARMTHLPERPLTGPGIGLRAAVEERGADAALLQRIDRGVGVLRR
jgi:hypothetical protein